ncbi:beta-ketoacyl-ACP synthase III [Alkalithermobacter paradoxus]|uniref:Beta-ketoacyl-[acyl-carrier-protein] synthase III n=1 Tax=Alkalithermobacter paradoxus TaxID=29349 RepID=A0A1V4IAN4_9FIRM|nr:3-oxoacyl-[acyl-carrier-protein] synthase 3 protein 1 [[Clostridium] thermoalcaliphilum]
MSKTKRAGVIGIGSFVPEKVLTNLDMEKIVDTSDEWILTRTGIKERRIADENTATSDLATEAAKKALESANVKPEEIDLIMVATVTPDMAFPSTACIVQKNIGASKAAAFDLEAACSGFIYGVTIGKQFIETGMYKKILVIGAETLSKIVDWSDRNTCVLFGDGAGAVVLGEVDENEGILSAYLGADGLGGEFLSQPAGGSRIPASVSTVNDRLHYIKMEGSEVFKFAVRIMGESAKKALELANLSSEDIDFIVPHQANIRIIESAAKRLKVSMDKVYVNLDRYGNMSSASIPVALNEAYTKGMVKKGDNVVLVGFGGGLTWGSALLKWSI